MNVFRLIVFVGAVSFCAQLSAAEIALTMVPSKPDE